MDISSRIGRNISVELDDTYRVPEGTLLFANEYLLAVRLKPETPREERVSIISLKRVKSIILDARPALALSANADFLKLKLGPETIGNDVLAQLRDQRLPCELFFENEDTGTGFITHVEDSWIEMRMVDEETWEDGGDFIVRTSMLVVITIGLATTQLISNALDPK
jgi:hypothetical protein